MLDSRLQLDFLPHEVAAVKFRVCARMQNYVHAIEFLQCKNLFLVYFCAATQTTFPTTTTLGTLHTCCQQLANR